MSRLAVVALFALLPVLYYASALAAGRVLAPADGLAYYFPVRTLAAASVKAGVLPFWNPYNFSGMPFLAAIQPGLFFPGNWSFLVLPPTLAMNVTALLAFTVAGLGGYAFGRAIAMVRAGAIATGMIFMLGGFMTLHVEHLTMIQAAGLMPWLLWAVERFRATGRGRFAGAAAALLGLQILAAHPQMTAYSTIVVGLYALFRLKGLERGARLGYLLHLGVALGLGIGLALFQLLPTFALIGSSTRQAIDYGLLTISSAQIQSWPALIAPYLYGVRSPQWPFTVSTWGSGGWMLGKEGFVGVVTALLALVALMGLKRDRQARFWGLVAVFGLVLALGANSPLYRLWAALPVVKMMPYASRHFLEFTWAVAVLAGLGLSAVARAEAKRGLALAVGVLGTALAGLWLAAAIAGPNLATRLQPYLPKHDMAWALSGANPAFWTPLAIALLAAALLWGLARRPATGWKLGLLGLLALELTANGHFQGRHPECPRVPAEVRPAMTVDFREGRVLPISRWVFPYGDSWDYLRAMRYPAVSAIDGVPAVNGYDAFIDARYAKLVGSNSGGRLKDHDRVRDDASRVYDVLAMRTLVLDAVEAAKPEWRALDDSPRWRRVPDPKGMVTYENLRAMPRAWRPTRAEVLSSDAVDERLLTGFDPATLALLEAPAASSDWTPGTAQAETLNMNEIRVQTEGAGPGMVVVSESFAPGWTATLGDRQVPIHRVDGLVMGIEVPAGAHVLTLRYAPPRFGLGLGASALALLALLGWLFSFRRFGWGRSPSAM